MPLSLTNVRNEGDESQGTTLPIHVAHSLSFAQVAVADDKRKKHNGFPARPLQDTYIARSLPPSLSDVRTRRDAQNARKIVCRLLYLIFKALPTIRVWNIACQKNATHFANDRPSYCVKLSLERNCGILFDNHCPRSLFLLSLHAYLSPLHP